MLNAVSTTISGIRTMRFGTNLFDLCLDNVCSDPIGLAAFGANDLYFSWNFLHSYFLLSWLKVYCPFRWNVRECLDCICCFSDEIAEFLFEILAVPQVTGSNTGDG
jgi:hypothetical protein